MLMTVDQAREALCDCRLSAVAAKSGVHYLTLKDIRDNPNANPMASTLKKIGDYFDEREKARKYEP